MSLLAANTQLMPIAGCTDVYVALQFGTVKDTRFIDLWPLDELRGITLHPATQTTGGGGPGLKDGVLRIGAMTTYTELIESKLVNKRLPMLVAAAREVGGVQIQNRGTLGGNIANGSPAGDTLPVLAAANASIILRNSRAERAVPFESYYTGYRASVRQPDELIVAIELPAVDGRQWWRKVGTRRAQAISKVMIAGVRGSNVRVAFGSVGPTVILARNAAAVLAAGGTIGAARAELMKEISPIDDLRSTREYRARVAANLLAEFWDATT